MTTQERIEQGPEAQRHLPSNVVPMNARPVRRAIPRWLEWTREHQTERTASQDLTGYLREIA